MMNARTAVSLALVVILLGAAGAALAQNAVTISSPKEGETVYGVVSIQATKTDPQDGFLSFRVLPTDRKYLVSTLAPATFSWNTQQRDSSGRQIYRDGQYTIEVAGYDGSGRLQERASVQVQVRNTIPTSELGGKVLLRVNMQRADKFLYAMEGTQTVDVPGRAGSMLRNPPQQDMSAMGMGGMGGGMGGFGGAPGMGMGGPAGMGASPETLGIPSTIKMTGDAQWTMNILSPSKTGRAVADNDLLRGFYTASFQWPKKFNEDTFKMETNVPDHFNGWLPGTQVQRPTEGRLYRTKILADGVTQPMHEGDGNSGFPMGYLFIELPDEPVSVGATWSGKMGITTGLTDNKPRIMDGSFKLEGFEYRGSHRCARITVTHTETNVQIPWDLPGKQAPAEAGMPGGGGMLGGPGGGIMGALTGALQGYAGALSAAMGEAPPAMPAMPPMGGGMAGPTGMGLGQGQVGPDGEPEGTLKGDIAIKRVVYFDMDAGRFVSFEDNITKKITKILAPPIDMGMGMGGGMGGMGGGMGGGFGGGMGGGRPGMSAGVPQKLDYRDLYFDDVQPLMSALVGSGTGAAGAPGAAQPGVPGGAPAGVPGMGGFGPGMGGGSMGQPPVKATINITTTLSVAEVRQVAGHAVAQR